MQSLRGILQRTKLRSVLTTVRHRGLRENDVFLASYPKSGMTWLRNLLAAYFLPDVDAWMDDIRKVSYTVGKHHRLKSFIPSGGRLINTHEPYRSKYKRVILLVRDGRDVAVSEFKYWQQHCGHKDFQGVDFPEFLDRFLSGSTHGFSAWHNHVHGWCSSPIYQSDSLCLVRYEDLKKDTPGQLGRMLEFLGVDIDTSLIERAVEKSSISNMRKVAVQNTQKESFVRRGESGVWSEMFTGNLLNQFEAKSGDALCRLGYALSKV